MEATKKSPTTSSRWLHSREKELIYNVFQFFSEEKANREPVIPLAKVIERTAKATKVSERTVRRICSGSHQASQKEKEPEQPVFSSPKKKQCRAPVRNIDNFDKNVVRKTVLQFYERKEIPTLPKVREALQEKISFTGCKETLRKILKDIGFRFSKVDGRRFLMERTDVVAARLTFLREIRHLKKSSRNIVYLDETWINQNYTDGKCWQDTTAERATGINPPTGKGSRLILLHAGTKEGFVENAELIFQAKNDGDYHHQMNSTVFEEWFKTQLLPNISPNSVIVMDNAAYHSVLLEKMPALSWRKSDLWDWLVKKGAQPSVDMYKMELYHMAKSLSVGRKYRIDTIAEEAGHKIIRLPPYNCQYNPIELIWAQVKSYVGKRNTFKMADLKPLLKEAINQVTAQHWSKAVQHAEQLQEEDSKNDIAFDHFVESFIINTSDTSDDEFSD